MKSLELIVTCVLILHILKPSDGVFHVARELLNVDSTLESLQKSDQPCGTPEALISILKGNDPTNSSPLGMMMASMDKITDITDPPNLTSVFDSLVKDMKKLSLDIALRQHSRWKSPLELYLSTINAHYDRFITLRKDKGPINVADWMAMATDIEETMPSNLTAFYTQFLSPLNRFRTEPQLPRLLERIAWKYRSDPHSNEKIFALSGIFNELLNLVFTTQLKATIPQIYASLLRKCNGPVRRDNLNTLAIEHKKRYLEFVRGLKDHLGFVHNNILPFRRNNGGVSPGDEYYELQTTLEYFSLVQFPDPQGHKDCLIAQQEKSLEFVSQSDVCNGTLYDCEYAMEREEYGLENERKWQKWIEASQLADGDRSDECHEFSRNHYVTHKNPSAGYCFCKCQERRNYISITPVMTNHSANMVVTGLRFVFQNNVLHLQVKQGKLLPGERIDPASVEWIPLPENPKVVPLGSRNGELHIDEVMADMNEVPVGLSFVQSDNGFYLQMYAISYELNQGITGTSIREVPPPHRDDSRAYVSFQVSGPVARRPGRGRPVCSFIDARTAEADPPAPLWGFGIAYEREVKWTFYPTIVVPNYSDIFEKIENGTL